MCLLRWRPFLNIVVPFISSAFSIYASAGIPLCDAGLAFKDQFGSFELSQETEIKSQEIKI